MLIIILNYLSAAKIVNNQMIDKGIIVDYINR